MGQPPFRNRHLGPFGRHLASKCSNPLATVVRYLECSPNICYPPDPLRTTTAPKAASGRGATATGHTGALAMGCATLPPRRWVHTCNCPRNPAPSLLGGKPGFVSSFLSTSLGPRACHTSTSGRRSNSRAGSRLAFGPSPQPPSTSKARQWRRPYRRHQFNHNKQHHYH